MSIAKALQVGATAYDKIFDPIERGVPSSTWAAGSRIDMIVGTKIIDVINRETSCKCNGHGEHVKKRVK
jgi:4-aminobutyrate aminotransferase